MIGLQLFQFWEAPEDFLTQWATDPSFIFVIEFSDRSIFPASREKPAAGLHIF